MGTAIAHYELQQRGNCTTLTVWSSGHQQHSSAPQCCVLYNGIQFCLCGGEEHWKLKLYQRGMKWATLTTVYSCTVWCSARSCRTVSCASSGCLPQLPKDAYKVEAFYFWPLPKLSQTDPWYTAVLIGENNLVPLGRTWVKMQAYRRKLTNVYAQQQQQLVSS